MYNPQIRLMALLMVMLGSAALLVEAQFPARLSIPGAQPIPARQQFRNGGENKVVRVRRPTALRAQNAIAPVASPPRYIEEAKPVTESAEEEDTAPDAFLPSLLREQQLAQAQQAQFHQAATAFLNGDNGGGLLQETPPTLLQEDEEPQLTLPTRFAERPQPQAAPTQPLRPVFNDYGIGAGFGGVQRFGSTAAPVAPPPPPPQPAPQRFNIIRSRPSRPHFEAQAAPAPAPAPAPARPRPKPIQPRPIIDQNQLQHEDRNGDSQRGRRPVAQTLRKWRDENEDGSITWGYENDDGSFKEELIGTDCITKGTYGYVDPDGNKREYHYETGIRCDPNARDAEEEELDDNGFINYEENRAVLPNGIEIDMSQLGKRKSKRPATNYRN